MMTGGISRYVHRLAQRLGPAIIARDEAGVRYTKCPALFEISAELVQRSAESLPARPRFLVFWEQAYRSSLYACPLTLSGLAMFALVSLLRAIVVTEGLAFLACATLLGVKPERAHEGSLISWGWIFGEDFPSFQWRSTIGEWTVRVIPR